MTGWAIINGGEDLSLEEKVDADEYYLKTYHLAWIST